MMRLAVRTLSSLTRCFELASPRGLLHAAYTRSLLPALLSEQLGLRRAEHAGARSMTPATTGGESQDLYGAAVELLLLCLGRSGMRPQRLRSIAAQFRALHPAISDSAVDTRADEATQRALASLAQMLSVLSSVTAGCPCSSRVATDTVACVAACWLGRLVCVSH